MAHTETHDPRITRTPQCPHCARFGHQGGRPRRVELLPLDDKRWSCPVCTAWYENTQLEAEGAPYKEQLPGFESEPCSRCGGTGRYSYCQMYGTMCFKCSGRKRLLTTRGKAAYAYYVASLPTKRLNEIAVGDLVAIRPTERYRVAEVWVETGSGCVDPATGKVRPHIAIRSEKLGSYHFATLDEVVTIWPSWEVRKQLWLAAMDYQATLTKQGKPRKRPVKESQKEEQAR